MNYSSVIDCHPMNTSRTGSPVSAPPAEQLGLNPFACGYFGDGWIYKIKNTHTRNMQYDCPGNVWHSKTDEQSGDGKAMCYSSVVIQLGLSDTHVHL